MRRIRNKSQNPLRPWDMTRIKEEKAIKSEYGLRRKREIRAAEEMLRNFRRRARELIAVQDKDKEKVLLDKLVKLGLLEKGAGLDDVLALNVKRILDRRLQTVVYRKGLAKTARQARQLVVHGHIGLGEKKATSPSMILDAEKDKDIKWRKRPIALEEKAPVKKAEPKAEAPAPEEEKE
jgi:small subunit ribosomal protein S4